MSRAQAESVIKKIIGDIVRECAVRGHAASDTLVAFVVKAVVLDPRNGFNVDRTLTKQDIHKLVQLCLDKLMEKCSPSLDTIKMQVYFDMNYTSRREFLEEIHRVVEYRLSTVSREITDSRVKTRQELDALYRSIVTYIMLRSSIGSTTDFITVQEATAALQSVLPQTELGAFMVLLKKDKEEQLNELTMIVTGIQLFNKAIKKDGEETDLHELRKYCAIDLDQVFDRQLCNRFLLPQDSNATVPHFKTNKSMGAVPAILNEALPVTGESIEHELSVSQALAWKYTAVLEKLTDPDSQPGECDVPIVLLKQALYNIRQHEVFLKMLLADACLCAEHVEILQTELSSQMTVLKETVQSKTAVPTAKVFPLFKALSKLWCGFQDEAELLNILNNIMYNLQSFVASQANIFSEAYLDDLLGATEVKTDEQRMAESSDERIAPDETKTKEWLLPETTTSFDELPLQYNGVCGYTLVNSDGLLLPGNPQIGVLKHEEKLFAFRSKEAALKFASNPDDFIAEVAEKAKRSPELIQLLKLHRQFSCVSAYSELQPGESLFVKPIIKCEIGTQTDIHPVETNIVKSYEWNEWELRRKALKLADLLTKATHSTQTNQSHMRRENVTQTWPPIDAACQTKRDGESNVPKPKIYVAGLRGQKDGKMVRTNLTRPVDE